MKTISFKHVQFKVKDNLFVKINDLTLENNELLVLIGANGSGKTLLAKALHQQFECVQGDISTKYTSALVSFEDQQQLFADDFELRNSDTASDEELNGISVASLFSSTNNDLQTQVIKALNIDVLLTKTIRQLSGGEGRRVLIAKALCQQPNLLILDTPFDALDISYRQKLLDIVQYIHNNLSTKIVLIVNRKEEIPSCCTNLGVVENLSIIKLDSYNKMIQDDDVNTLLYIKDLPDIMLPKAPNTAEFKTDSEGNVFSLNNINISYDRPIIKNFSFSLKQGKHVLITGENGAGKSTLISLITGDNPLVYTNDVCVFGYKRGNGESIWDIKKHYGQVSAALHLDYRVSSSALNVVLSGLYDSIGLYTQVGDNEKAIAMQYLKLLNLQSKASSPFNQLSFGQQRLLLIARALIKQPALLILDEPLQGLDPIARAMVKSYINYFMQHSKTSIVFVSHHKEDIPKGFDYEINFVKQSTKPLLYDIQIIQTKHS